MATHQPILFKTTDTAHTTSTEYLPINARGMAWNSTAANRRNSIPTGGGFRQLNIKIDTAPGAGKSYEFALMVNGSPSASLIGSISDTDTTLTVTGTQAVSEGDIVQWRLVPSGTPTPFTRVDGNMIWEPTIDNEFLVLGSVSDNVVQNATEYNHLECGGNAPSWATSENNARQVVAAPGDFKKLHVGLSATPGGSDDYTFTLRVNNASPGSGPSVVLNDADFDKVDSTNTAAVVAGDTVDLQCVGSATAASVRADWSCVFTPTTPGNIILLGGTASDLHTTVTEYSCFGAQQPWHATEANVDIDVYNISMVLNAIYIKLNNTPGTSKSFDFDVMKDGVAEAGLAVSIANSNTTGNATGQTITIADHNLDIRVVPVNTPGSTRDAYFGILFTFAEMDFGGGGGERYSYCPGIIV